MFARGRAPGTNPSDAITANVSVLPNRLMRMQTSKPKHRPIHHQRLIARMAKVAPIKTAAVVMATTTTTTMVTMTLMPVKMQVPVARRTGKVIANYWQG